MVIAVVALGLAGCGPPPPLPPPGATGTVAIHVWEAGNDRPTVVVAERIVQDGLRFDHMVLEKVRARVVQKDLDLAVSAPSGQLSMRAGQLSLDGPVHLAGAWQEHPVLGIATAASMSRDGEAILLERVELWHQGERTRAPLMELHRDRTLVAPRGLDTDPLPPELAAAFAALPDPLPLPR